MYKTREVLLRKLKESKKPLTRKQIEYIKNNVHLWPTCNNADCRKKIKYPKSGHFGHWIRNSKFCGRVCSAKHNHAIKESQRQENFKVCVSCGSEYCRKPRESNYSFGERVQCNACVDKHGRLGFRTSHEKVMTLHDQLVYSPSIQRGFYPFLMPTLTERTRRGRMKHNDNDPGADRLRNDFDSDIL